MTQEIIELAKQAGMHYREFEDQFCEANTDGVPLEMLSKFFRLAYARGMLKCEKQMMQLFLDPENQPTQFGTATQEYREQEIKDERESCAKVCDDIDTEYEGEDVLATWCSQAIRARGQE
jgi:hypothetical protein